jgi:hypothetical protein
MATPRKDAEIEDTTKALKQQAQTPAQPQGESNWDRITAGLRDAAGRSSEWVGARVKDTLGDFVGRFLHGETSSPAPSDQHLDQAREVEKGMDR